LKLRPTKQNKNNVFIPTTGMEAVVEVERSFEEEEVEEEDLPLFQT
jgi:hypothetical protein